MEGEGLVAAAAVGRKRMGVRYEDGVCVCGALRRLLREWQRREIEREGKMAAADVGGS